MARSVLFSSQRRDAREGEACRRRLIRRVEYYSIPHDDDDRLEVVVYPRWVVGMVLRWEWAGGVEEEDPVRKVQRGRVRRAVVRWCSGAVVQWWCFAARSVECGTLQVEKDNLTTQCFCPRGGGRRLKCRSKETK